MDRKVLNDIYTYWFGDCAGDRLDPDRIRIWMDQSDATDQAVRERFGRLLPAAASVAWNIDLLSRKESIALVVLFDQFPRNLYRSSAEAYAYDHLARDIAQRLIARGWEQFTLMERFLLGLPFVHHEDLDDQAYALKLAGEISIACQRSDEERHRLVDQAVRHWEVIRLFGRFPHRNAMLGRVPTPEEATFVADHGRGF
jgi:uncharacterized protein (DUF924 family)